MMLGPLLLGRTPSLVGALAAAAGTATASRHALAAAPPTPAAAVAATAGHHHLPSCRRSISEETLNASRDQVADLFSRNVARQRGGGGGGVLLPRREALALYREILRYSNLFVWRDDKGRRWRDVIRESARKEFEDARYERDPAIVSKLIVTGRDCVERTVEAFLKRRQRIIEEEASQQDAAAAAAANQEHRRRGGTGGILH